MQMKVPATVIDGHLDQIRTEYSNLQNQLQQARHELEKATQANQELTQRYYLFYQEATFSMYVENQKNLEIIKRLSGIITHTIPHLPAQHQETIMSATERAKNITPQEMQSVMQQQQQLAAASMFPGMSTAGLGASMMPAAAAAAAAFNPAMLGMAAMKPEDAALQAAAMFQNLLKSPGILPNALGMGHTGLPTTSGGPSTSNSLPAAGLNDDTPRSSDSTLRASSSHNRPQSGSPAVGTKRAKIEPDEDGEFEIDVQNDDANSTTAPATNGRSSQPVRGSSRSGVHKDDRDGAQSTSSRDSATPRSKRQSSTPSSLAGFLPPGATPEMANLLMNTGGRFSIPTNFQNQLMLTLMPQMNGKPTYAFKVRDGGQPEPATFPSDAAFGSDVIKSMKRLGELPHGDVVCATTITRDNRQVYTGGRGCVKVWNIEHFDDETQLNNQDKTSVTKLKCLNDSYIRFCKLYQDDSSLIVGGESPNICIWDVNKQTIRTELTCDSQACYALVTTPDGRMCFSCCADGNIVIWDLVSETKVAALNGHVDGASCVDIFPQDMVLWTGGLDSTVRSWDIRERTELSKHELESQVFSLGCCPNDDYVAVGMENNYVEVLNTKESEKYVLHDHESCVLSLKFAHSGKWFISTGKDNYLSTWRIPYGFRLVKQKETSSILSCDISIDDRFIITGSGDKKASIYEVGYG